MKIHLCPRCPSFIEGQGFNATIVDLPFRITNGRFLLAIAFRT